MTEWYSGDYYANPTGNDRWIVWIQEEADFDRSLPSPNARRDTDIRQAVFGWYDLQTGQVRTMKLDVLFDYHPSLSPPALGLYNDMALIQVGMDIGDVETHVLLVDLKHGTTRRLNEGYVFTRDYSLWVSNDRVTLWQLSQHSTSDHLLQIRTSVEAFSTKKKRQGVQPWRFCYSIAPVKPQKKQYLSDRNDNDYCKSILRLMIID